MQDSTEFFQTNYSSFSLIEDPFSQLSANTTLFGLGNSNIIGSSSLHLLSSSSLAIEGTSNNDILRGGSGNETLLGFNSQDELFGGAGDDVLDGGDGDDKLFGEQGNDTLLGGSGQDELQGGIGDDLLNGGQGDNTLTGGAGSDTFVISRLGKNRITDFEDGIDRLALEDGLTFNQLRIFEQNRETWITTLDNQPLAFLPGVNPSQITKNDFSLPDLRVTVSTPGSALPGDSPSIEVRVKNVGSSVALGTNNAGVNGYMVDFILSSDTEVPEGFATYSPNYSEDVLLLGGRLSNTPDLIPGEEFVFTVSGGIPTDTPDGNYYIAARIDPGQKIDESDEGNNTSFAPIQIASTPTDRDDEFFIYASDIPGFQLLEQPLQVAEGFWLLGTGPSPDELRLLLPTNLNAADTTNTDQLWSGGGLGLNLNGAGLTVGVWEAGGWVRGTHQELTGRVTFGDGDSSRNFTNHATHVAGTIAATGIDPTARGMANQVNIRSYDSNNDFLEMRRAADPFFNNLIVASNHSYADWAGWDTRFIFNNLDFNTDGTPDPVDTWFEDRTNFAAEDTKFGKYNDASRELDQVLYDYPNLLSVWAASNDRNDIYTNAHGDNTYVAYFSTSPVAGFNLPGGYWLVSTNNLPAPPQDGNSGEGFDSLPPSQVAKNSLVVGAINDITVDPYSSANVTISNFSSWGPTDDGRIKPDVVANGVNLRSSVAGSDNAYDGSSGTSMAAPNVTGTAVLLIEHNKNLFNFLPRSATTKGLLIHTATDAGNVGPDYTFGWGVVNAAAAANFLTNAQQADSSEWFQESVYAGSERTMTFVSDGSSPLKATIAWTDPPGNPQDDGLDVNTPVLVNDLELWITGPGGTYYPWVLNPANPNSPATPSASGNHLDNVEQVLINAPVAGEYTVHIGRTGNFFVQDYSLLVSGASPAPMPDLVVTSFEITGPASGNDLPVRLVVKNQGDQPATPFKVSVDFTRSGEDESFVVAFNADDTSDVDSSNFFYPFTENSLAPGQEVTFTGNLRFGNNSLTPGQSISLVATADSTSGDEFIPDTGRVLESREYNNLSTTISWTPA